MLIQLSSVVKTYNFKKPNEVQALRSIDFQLEKGRMVSIVGPSGSGKTTLLNLIGCIDRATSGEYIFDGDYVAAMSDRQLASLRNQRIGFALQSFGLLPDRTVYENVSVPFYFSKKKTRQMQSRVMQSLIDCGMEEFSRRKASQLSGGQQQRVAISRAMVMQPDLLLADEPTGSLDTSTAKDIMEVFKRLNYNGTTIIIVTHNSLIANMCDKTFTLSDGRFL